MESASNALEVLAEDECLTLLGVAEVGRVGVVVDGQPLIFPVNHVLDGRSIVVRTDSARMGPKPRLLRIDVRTITGRRFAGERSDQ